MARYIYLGVIAVLALTSCQVRGRNQDHDELRSTSHGMTRSKPYQDIVAEKIYNDIKDDMNKDVIKQSLEKRGSRSLNEVDEYHLGFPYVPTKPRPDGLWGKRNIINGPPGLWGREAENSLKRGKMKQGHERSIHHDVVKGPPGLWGREALNDRLDKKFDSNGPPGMWGRELREKLHGRIFNVGPPGLWGRDEEARDIINGPPGLWGRDMDFNEGINQRAANVDAVHGPPGLWGRSFKDVSHQSNRLKREGPPGLWGRDVVVGPPGLWGKRVVKRLLTELIENDLERLDGKSHTKP